jgi:hypothetical protein
MEGNGRRRKEEEGQGRRGKLREVSKKRKGFNKA